MTESNGKNPNLVIENPKTPGITSERRRRPRLNLAAEQFRLAANGKIFSVIDLSSEGMALRVLDHDDFLLFPITMELAGTINLKGNKFPLKARVRRLGIDLVGCEFVDLPSDTRAAVEQFLSPEFLGKEIKPIPAGDGATLWYHGPSGTDVILVRGVDGQYRRLTIYVLGCFVQWEQELGLVTGRTESSHSPSSSQDEIWGVVRFETLLMHNDAQPDPAKLRIAKALLLSSNLPQDLKKWCARTVSPVNEDVN
ncbi:MAG: PilZ domain-containing protein [Oligoflexia bacterium]|nr:PilZ domain-containing protein [Oligoflexia bacterium]